MALQITITDAGRAEIINAANTGTAPVEITEVGLGTGNYVPDPTQTALQTETKRLTTIAGLSVAADTIHLTIKDESADVYDVSEFGLYTASGTLFAVYSDAVNSFMQKAAGNTLLLSVDIVLGTLDATNVTFGDTAFANPPASETVSGVLKLSDLTQATSGTDTSTAMTPKRVNEALSQFGLFGVSKNQSTGDADSITKNGMYYFSSGLNIPIPNGHLIHQQVTADYAVQYFSPGTLSSLGGMYHRRKVLGVWQGWQELAHTGNETTLLSGNGYKKFLGGLIIQWGIVTGSASSDVAVTLPIAFPNSPFRTYTEAVAAGAARTTTSVSQSTTGFNTSIWGLDGLRKAEPIYWLAFGY
ncbi:phage tail protein [Thiomicrorhabdus sp.]|uniref:gp53-like domain-containing protein n=1 Tax=Thiomicrorhabdus sp. TaxID=2039724 RepID=UPI00356A6B0D